MPPNNNNNNAQQAQMLAALQAIQQSLAAQAPTEEGGARRILTRDEEKAQAEFLDAQTQKLELIDAAYKSINKRTALDLDFLKNKKTILESQAVILREQITA